MKWEQLRLGLGMSRHSALSALRSATNTPPPPFATQALSLLIGSGLIGIAVALLVEARLGLAPYDVLASGLSQQGGLSLGQASWLIAAVLSLAATLLGRRPSLWSIAYVLLNGFAIDAASGILQHPSSILLRIVFVPAGILVMAAGINVVVHSGTTGGPFELLMAAGENEVSASSPSGTCSTLECWDSESSSVGHLALRPSSTEHSWGSPS